MSTASDPAEALVYRGLRALVQAIDGVHQSGEFARRSGIGLERSLLQVLVVLGEHEYMRTTDLARALALRSPTVSRHVARAERLGLVERTSDPRDGRASVLTLSVSGRRTVASVQGTWAGLLREALSPVPDEERPAFAARFLAVASALHDAALHEAAPNDATPEDVPTP